MRPANRLGSPPNTRIWLAAQPGDRKLRPSPLGCTRLCPDFGLDRPFPEAAFDALDDPIFNAAVFHVRPASKGAFRSTSPHRASYWPISLLKSEAFSRSKSRSPIAA